MPMNTQTASHARTRNHERTRVRNEIEALAEAIFWSAVARRYGPRARPGREERDGREFRVATLDGGFSVEVHGDAPPAGEAPRSVFRVTTADLASDVDRALERLANRIRMFRSGAHS